MLPEGSRLCPAGSAAPVAGVAPSTQLVPLSPPCVPRPRGSWCTCGPDWALPAL